MIQHDVSSETIIISLAPKIRMEKITSKLDTVTRIVGIKPNSTSFINEGYNHVSLYDRFLHMKKKLILELLEKPGLAFEVMDLIPVKPIDEYEYQIHG